MKLPWGKKNQGDNAGGVQGDYIDPEARGGGVYDYNTGEYKDWSGEHEMTYTGDEARKKAGLGGGGQPGQSGQPEQQQGGGWGRGRGFGR